MHIPKRVWALTGTMFLGALALSLVYMYLQLHALPDVPKNALNPLIVATHPGTLKLETDSRGVVFEANKEIEIILSGDSKEIPVGGYDAVINYDPDMLEFISAKNEMEDFNFFITQKTNQITFTSSVKLSSRPSPIADGILATLRFKSKKEGKTMLTFQYKPDATIDSNMLSNKMKDILGTVGDLNLVIGKKLTLSRNKPSIFEGKTITLVEVSIPAANCSDCLSLVRVGVEENGQTDILSYKNGGIEGLIERERNIGNMVYRLEDANEAAAVLIIGER